MKNLSVVVVAFLLAAPVFADTVQSEAQPQVALAAVEATVSSNVQVTEANDLGARLDKDVKDGSESFSAKIEAEIVAEIAKAIGVTF